MRQFYTVDMEVKENICETFRADNKREAIKMAKQFVKNHSEYEVLDIKIKEVVGELDYYKKNSKMEESPLAKLIRRINK